MAATVYDLVKTAGPKIDALRGAAGKVRDFAGAAGSAFERQHPAMRYGLTGAAGLTAGSEIDRKIQEKRVHPYLSRVAMTEGIRLGATASPEVQEKLRQLFAAHAVKGQPSLQMKTADDNKGVDPEGMMQTNKKEDTEEGGENVYGIGKGVKNKPRTVEKKAEVVAYISNPVPGSESGMFFKSANEAMGYGSDVASATRNPVADVASMGHGKGLCSKCGKNPCTCMKKKAEYDRNMIAKATQANVASPVSSDLPKSPALPAKGKGYTNPGGSVPTVTPITTPSPVTWATSPAPSQKTQKPAARSGHGKMAEDKDPSTRMAVGAGLGGAAGVLGSAARAASKGGTKALLGHSASIPAIAAGSGLGALAALVLGGSGSEKKADPNTQVDGADRTGRDYQGPLAAPRNALFGHGDGERTHGVNEGGSFSSGAAKNGHGKMKKKEC